MMQYEEMMNLLESSGGDSNLLNPLAGIQDMLPMIIIWSLIISSVIILAWIVSIISRFRAERAMVRMQKDLKAVRELLEQKFPATPAPVAMQSQPTPINQEVGSGEANNLIS